MHLNLKSTRLLLSPVVYTDLTAIHELHSRPETDQYNTLGIPENVSETEALLIQWLLKPEQGDPQKFILKVERLKDQAFIGLIALNLGRPKFKIAEIWYQYFAEFWNQGYATEALLKILDFGFNDLGLHRIEAGCAVDNIGSIRVLEKAGMLREGRKRKVLPLKDGWSDNYHYAILSSDFEASMP